MNGPTRLVELVVWRIPSLAPVLAEHLADMGSELLPHPFFSDVMRWAAHQARLDSDSRDLHELLAVLEEAWDQGDPEVLDLISTSFLEMTPLPGEEGAEIREWLPPMLRRQLERIEGLAGTDDADT